MNTQIIQGRIPSATQITLALLPVAQIFNLLYRRVALGWAMDVPHAPDDPELRGLQIRDTAECNSALRGQGEAARECEDPRDHSGRRVPARRSSTLRIATGVVLIALCLTTSNSLAQPASAADEAAKAIDTLREGLISTFTKGDVDGLLQHLDTNVVVTWQNGEVCRGREAVRAFYNRMMVGDQRVVREIKSAPEVLGRQAQGDWAVSWGNLHDHFVLNSGKDLPFNSVFTATIAKRGDRWLVTAFHASINAFSNPVLRLAARETALWIGLGAGVVGLVVGFLVGRKKRA